MRTVIKKVVTVTARKKEKEKEKEKGIMKSRTKMRKIREWQRTKRKRKRKRSWKRKMTICTKIITYAIFSKIIVENIRDRKSTRLNSSHLTASRMPSSA